MFDLIRSFMFQLSETEWKELITNCDNLGANKFSPTTLYALRQLLVQKSEPRNRIGYKIDKD